MVESKLQLRWSPEQISSWVVLAYPEDAEMRVSHETIYLSLFVPSRGALRKELTRYLRRGHATRWPLGHWVMDGQGQLRGMVHIRERPAEADDRAVPGPIFAYAHELLRTEWRLARHRGQVLGALEDERARPVLVLRELADAWRGFDDVKSFGSLEGGLTVDARHDGHGTVYCEVRLRQPWPPEWALSAVLDFGAGAHLEHLAECPPKGERAIGAAAADNSVASGWHLAYVGAQRALRA